MTTQQQLSYEQLNLPGLKDYIQETVVGGGTADAITIVLNAIIPDGAEFNVRVKVPGPNTTTAPTLQVSGWAAAKTIVRRDGQPLIAGDLNSWHDLRYDSVLGEFVVLNVDNPDATLTALANLVTSADTMPYFTGVDTANLTALTAYARTFLADADAASARLTLGLGDSATLNVGTAAGTVAAGDHLHTGVYEPANANIQAHIASTSNPHNVTVTQIGAQPLDATLTALASVVTSTDTLIYATGADTFSTTSLTLFARTLLGDVDAAAARTTLGLGNSATLNVGTTTGTVAAGDHNHDLVYIKLIEKGAPNGVATLDASSKITSSQLPDSLLGGVIYQGTWDALTNTPTLTSSTGTKGWYYVVSVAGSTNLDGITDWKVGDWAIFDGTVWDKVDNTDSVISVNGHTGIVTLTKADVGLDQVDNTSDLNKPISTATQTALNGKQPLDATLTALAGVTTAADTLIYATGVDTFSTTSLTAYARTLISSANATTALSTLGGQPLDATLTALAGVTTAADTLIYATGIDTFSTTTLTPFIRTLLDDVDATTARTTLGAQASSAILTSLSGQTTSADTLPYFSNIDTVSLTTLTSFARTILDDIDAVTTRTTLGLGSGTPTNGQLLIGNGTSYSTNNLTAGTGINIVNGVGTITIESLGSGVNWVLKTSAYTAVTGDYLLTDTSGGVFTVTLPATPTTGNSVVVADAGTWATNNLTVARNGSTIEGLAEDMIMDVSGVYVTFTYDGTTWQMYANAISASSTTVTGATGFEQTFMLMGV